MINNVTLLGRVSKIEEKTYHDGVTVTHFNLSYRRDTRTDVFPCRIISRLCPRKMVGMAEDGDLLQLTGHLTTFGSNGRVGIEVVWWSKLAEVVV